MGLQHPEALYFILPAMLALLGLALYARAMRRRAAAAFADAAMRERILPRENSARFWLKLLLWEAAVVFALLALARPLWGDVVEDVKIKGSDLYVLIDVSRSMLARDVAPSRLERAKLDVSSLLNRLKGERVGLIAFAGRAAVKCPLTADYAFFRVALNELGPHSVDRGGTAIGDAIRVALNVLPVVADRDQALLLITDGDDQDSEPLRAAAEAAERHVVIFTVGLGDPNEGAKIPDKDGQNVRFEGKDVVSKLDDELLRKIALDTNGAYVPARTSAYDLGKLYEEKLSLLRGEYAKEQKRRRMSERFEIPLVLSVLCFMLELMIRPYDTARDDRKPEKRKAKNNAGAAPISTRVLSAGAVLLLVYAGLFGANACAEDGGALAREGLSLYDKKEFAAAGEKLNEAEKSFDREQREDAARAAFDAGCAFQRASDADKARDAYMKAALAPSKPLAASAQYNLGTLAADEAKKLAGEAPEQVLPEKRAEIVDKLKSAVGHFRNALELQPEYPGARGDIELLRQWLKLYANKWLELDRKKHRDSLNLMEYLDELAKTQRGLRSAAKTLDANASADELADLRRAQDELLDEIGPLKEKIQKEVGAPPAGGNPAAQPAPDPKMLEQAIKKLQEWADESGAKMRSAGDKFNSGDLIEAIAAQKEAVAPLERCWEALAPFGVTLQRDFDEQTKIVGTLDPNAIEVEKKADSKEAPTAKEKPELNKEQIEELAEFQSDVRRRTEALTYKAEKELTMLEKNAPPADGGATKEKKEKEWLTLEDVEREEAQKKKALSAQPPKDAKPEDADAPPDPAAIKKGLEKAIELAPKAAEKMNLAAGQLNKQERDAALPDAVEARRILKEILDAQPKQKKKDQKQDDKKEQQKKDQEQGKQEQNKDKQDQKKKDDEKKQDEEQQKKDQEKKDQGKQQSGKQGQEKQQSMSKEQAEELLRKVQEREMQRRKVKADEKQAIYGRLRGVEKDW